MGRQSKAIHGSRRKTWKKALYVRVCSERKPWTTVVVEQNEATIVTASGSLAKGMPLRVEGQETTIQTAEEDAYGRIIGQTVVDLPDGTYKGVVVTEQLHPIEFLLTSR